MRHTCPATAAGPTHSHRCRGCGAEWSHRETSFECAACHECPSCGRPEYGRAGGALAALFERWFDEVA